MTGQTPTPKTLDLNTLSSLTSEFRMRSLSSDYSLAKRAKFKRSADGYFVQLQEATRRLFDNIPNDELEEVNQLLSNEVKIVGQVTSDLQATESFFKQVIQVLEVLDFVVSKAISV